MKIVTDEPEKILLRLDPGEEIVGELVKFFALRKIGGAEFTALGAVAWVELAFYDRKLKDYAKQRVEGDLEILNLTGNVSWLAGSPIVHAHGTFGRSDFSVIGGHVAAAAVSATCEIDLRLFKGEIKRERNEDSGLNLLTR